jgi:hypothetical protein
MRLRFRPLWLAAATLVFTSGCALQSTRYDYSRLAAGLGDYDESIIDWNFPTSTNQGPLLPPQRFRPYPPALGVPWATGNPMPWDRTQAPASDAAAQADPAGHEATHGCAAPCDSSPPVEAGAVADARVREPSVPR